jgi:hypothetical protein
MKNVRGMRARVVFQQRDIVCGNVIDAADRLDRRGR